MKNILDIGHTDLRIFLRKRSAWVWLFVVPTAFIYFMGLTNRGRNDPENRRPALLIENRDTNFLGRLFLQELDAQGMRLVSPTNGDSAARGIRIPSDFTDAVLGGKRSRVEFVQRPDSGEADTALIEIRLVRALIAMNSHLIEAMGGIDTNGIVHQEGLQSITEKSLRQIIEKPNPVILDSHFAGRKPVPTGFNFSLPGNLIMYLMMNLLVFGGMSVAVLRRNGVLKRFIITPVTRNEIVMGKIYGLMLLGSVQIAFLLAVGKILFHVNLGANLPAVTLMLLVFAWVGGSFGVLLGSFVSSEDRVVGICVLTSVLLAALGGCWWPLEVAPPALKTLALCTPTGWALKALHQLISFGSGFGAVLGPVTVLLGFGAAANLLAIRFFRTQ